MTFNLKGYLIKCVENNHEVRYEWRADSTLMTSDGSRYFYISDENSLIYGADEKNTSFYIINNNTGLLESRTIKMLDTKMMDFFEITQNGYKITTLKNNENYRTTQVIYHLKDIYNNPYVYDVTSSDGSKVRLYSIYKYFDAPYVPVKNVHQDAHEIFINALYHTHISKDLAKGKTMLNDALQAYTLKGDSVGIHDCQLERIRLFCVLKEPQHALEIASRFKTTNELEQSNIYNSIAECYLSINDIAKSDSLQILGLKSIIKYHEDYKGQGSFPDNIRQQFFKIYDNYMTRGNYLKATAITEWQLNEMEAFGVDINDPNYQRAVAYHIDASYALNPQFVSLAEKCEKLVDHLNSFPAEMLASHPTLQSELLAAAKYCLVCDKWDVAEKLLNAYSQREVIGKKEIPYFWKLEGDLHNNKGDKSSALAYYLEGFKASNSVNDRLLQAITLSNLIFVPETPKETIKKFIPAINKFYKSIDDKNEKSLTYGYYIYATALEIDYAKRAGYNVNELSAINFYNKASQNFLHNGNTSLSAEAKMKEAGVYELMGFNVIAIDLYTKVLESRTILPGSARHFELLTKRGADCDKIGFHDLAAEDYAKALSILRQRIKRTFLFLTERQRANFISEQGLLFDALSNDSTYTHGELRFNAALLNKNLLLSSSSKLRSTIEASGDRKLIADYRRLRDAIGSGNNSDSIETLERSIQKRSAAYGDYTAAVDIDMTKVQDALKAGEYAIEIVPLKVNSVESYVALVLGNEGVTQVPLFTANEIKIALGGDIYSPKSTFGKEFWHRLGKGIPKSSKLYISPDGPFHSIAFEYLSVDGKHRANEVYDISRVSSTREICLGAQKRAIDGGALFGGIDYNLDSEDKQLALEEAGLVRGHVGENLGKDVMPWLFLPGTLGEVRAIDKSLEKAGKSSRLFTSDLALEEAFYSLSGKSPSILHMATHGFYLPQYQGANPLSKTGLIMAGANHFWREGWNLAPEPHDGILTGTEIAGLDLGNTDLVVLSACQSGLGDVSAEGVFGLPRAFKKSGAGSILMSLWPVHDDATRMLMDEFYKSLLSGKTKQQSLLDAQAAVKRAKFTTPSGSKESGSDPKYWAAFVLLD